MSRWDFRRESTHPVDGANTIAGLEAGYQPFHEADNHASKRNVVATEKGWVRRQSYVDAHGNVREKEEVMVAAHPGGSDAYIADTHLGNPDIAQLYFPAAPVQGSLSNVHVVFNTPITYAASGNAMTITLANTVSGAHVVASAAENISGNTQVWGNNTVVFNFTIATSGTYQINAQSIVVTGGGNPLYNPDLGVGSAANLVITGAVSNTFGTFVA